MIARCARCQGTFTTDRFGRLTCPHCGSELILADPNAPPPGAPARPPPGAAAPGAPERPAPPPASAGGLPPPPPPPPGGSGPPAGGWGPPPGGGWGPPGGGGFGGPPPPGPGPGEVPSPFAERASRGFFASFFETWKLVATQPQEFFRRVRIDQTGTAVLFGVLATLAGTIVAALYNLLSARQTMVAMQRVMEKMPEDEAAFLRSYAEIMTGGAVTVGQIVVSPIVTVVSIYLGAALLHLVLMLFRGAKRPFDATLTAVAYAHGLNLLLVVPGCGGLVALVWAVVVLVIGLGEIQRCGQGKAAAAVLSPVVLVCLCCCGLLGLGIPAAVKAIQEATKHGGAVNL
jgi:hypothetical protein